MSVCRTVSEMLFSVKKRRDLETGVIYCSRSLKMAPFDRLYMTFYWSAIVCIALSCTVSSYLTLNNIVSVDLAITFVILDTLNIFIDWLIDRDLEIWVRGHLSSFKTVQFESLGEVSYSPFIVTVVVSCISSEIKPDIGRKSWFFIPPCILRPR